MFHRVNYAKAALAGILSATILFAGPHLHAQTQLRKVKLAAQKNVGTSCVFIAQARGYFKDEGVELDFNVFSSAQDAVMATVANSTDFGMGGITSGFVNIAAKGGLKLVAASAMEKKGYQNLGLLATNAAYDAGLKSVKDLSGKRVGLTESGGAAAYDLLMMAKNSGISIDKVTVVPLQSVPNLVAAFKGGQIDALVQSSPTPQTLQKQGLGHVVAWASDLVETQAAVVFTRPALIAKDPDLVRSFVRAYVRGCADYNAAFNQLDANGNLIKGPGYDELMKVLSDGTNLPPDQVAEGLSYIDAKGRIAVSDLASEIEYWKQLGQVGQDSDLNKMIDPSFTDGHL